AAPEDAGRALFDGGGLWSRLRSRLPFGESAPAWPGRAGQRVRVGSYRLTLDRPLGEEDGARRWSAVERDYEVEIAPPGRRAPSAGIAALEGAGVPHERLLALSADGRVAVKERVDGWPAPQLLKSGLSRSQNEGWAELGARLIRAGVSADLSPENLIWQHWRSRWVLRDVRGAAPTGPADVLAGLLTPAAEKAGVEPADFLAGLRGRLGPDSEEWRRTLAALRGSPRLAPDLAALEERDRALPGAPRVVFGPAPGTPAFPDRAGRPAEAAKVLGYDPLTAEPRQNLHLDDPGKLNTLIVAVEPPGRTPAVVKTAEWDIVRNELAVRRVARRFFGRYFDVPSALGVERGRDSYLVMELKPGSRSWSRSPLTRDQRAALGILARAFGLGDMNRGNLLHRDGARPVLLDFEQAFGRAAPVASRLPDERIAEEMPWTSLGETNRIEDYQPAIRAWRRLLDEPGTKAALLSDFEAAGFDAAHAARLLDRVERNTADLDWTLQNDVDFVNQFANRARQSPVPAHP
ncbi:MAG: hypothetical protein KGM24_12440, partial [Elusimicrobia bacterium]|nr:hypothetical protein [Elusimicrobiota bacterium]